MNFMGVSSIDQRIKSRVDNGIAATIDAIKEAEEATDGSPQAMAAWLKQKNISAYSSTIRRMMVDKDYVFYWRFVNGLRVICMDKDSLSRSVTEPISILINEDDVCLEVAIAPYFYMLTESSQIQAIEHEVLHRALNHGGRAASMPVKSVASIAADLAVNSFVDTKLKFREGYEIEGHSPASYSSIEPGCAMEQYYEGIYEKSEGKNKESGDQNEQEGKGEGSDKQTQMMSSGGGGGGGDGDHGNQDQDNQQCNDTPDTKSSEGDSESGNDNSEWPDFDDFKSSQQESSCHPDLHPWADESKKQNQSVSDALIEGQVDEASKSWGNLPSDLVTEVERARPSKRRSWVLNIQTMLHDDRRKRGVWRLSYRRANRRDDNDVLPGRRRKEMPRVAVAIDTSGSMPDEILQEIINALPHLDRQARIGHVIQCDHTIHYNKLYNPNDLTRLYGRGGTSFKPVFDWLNNDIAGKRYSYVFYFTDGFAVPIEEEHVRDNLKVVWIDTSGQPEDERVDTFKMGAVFELTDLQGRPISQYDLRQY